MLLCVEVIFASVFIAAVPLVVYRNLHSVWAGFFITLVRIILIGTMFFDYYDVDNGPIERVQMTIIVVMVAIYIIVTIISVLKSILQFGMALKGILCPSLPLPPTEIHSSSVRHRSTK